MNAFKVARAMATFTVDNKSRALQQQDLLAYVRELTTRMPELNFLREYREHDFDIEWADFSTPTPTDGDRITHAPIKTRQDPANVFTPTVKGNAAAIVQDNKSRALQQQDLLAYVRELTTRMPELNFLPSGSTASTIPTSSGRIFSPRRRPTATEARTRRPRLARIPRTSSRPP